MYDENFHQWEVIPLHLIRITFGKNSKFYSNLSYQFSCILEKCFSLLEPTLYCFSRAPFLCFIHFLWYDKDILISNKPIDFKHFSNNNLNCVTQFFSDTGNIKWWIKLKHEFNLNNIRYFKWMQLIHWIPQKWKNAIKNNRISENLLFLNHHFIKCNILLSLEKLNPKELYLIHLTRDFCKRSSQNYFEKHFNDCALDWTYIYILPGIVTSDRYTRYFQYKVLNRVLYLNEKLFFWYIWNFSILFL